MPISSQDNSIKENWNKSINNRLKVCNNKANPRKIWSKFLMSLFNDIDIRRQSLISILKNISNFTLE